MLRAKQNHDFLFSSIDFMIYALARDTIPVRENDVNYLYNVMAGEMLHVFLFFFLSSHVKSP